MEASILIQNLKCGGCAKTITKNVSEISGVSEVFVDVESSCVEFIYDTPNTLELVKNSLKKLGYPEDGEANSLGSKAKSYVSCAIGKMST
jgi:copper chaperone